MSPQDEAPTSTTRPKSRKSLAHVPSTRSMDQENMTADIGALTSQRKSTPAERPAKRSRSKSIGPGGLDALKDTSGNRRKSLALVPQSLPRSILKPTMPPLPEIPAHISTRGGSPKNLTPRSIQATDNLLDFSIASPSTTTNDRNTLVESVDEEGGAAISETRVTLRTEQEQEAASRKRDERDRQELEKEAISRRDARRKSLANRRVSFAPEATLHTWDVVVEYQDSTASSNATSSTRRTSSASNDATASPRARSSDHPDSDSFDPPSTPPDKLDEGNFNESPAHQRNLHQKKRRRSSGIPPMNFNNPDDEGFSSSPFSGDSIEDADDTVDDDESNSATDSGDDEGTRMSLEGGETTNMSMASIASDRDSTNSSIRLEDALREASRQAGTQVIDYDENGNIENAEEDDVVASFAPWGKTGLPHHMEAQRDQENINPFSPAFKASVPAQHVEYDEEEMTMDMTHAVGGILPELNGDEEMSMDVTRALGGIISKETEKKPDKRRKSHDNAGRLNTRRRSSGAVAVASLGDETMDLTPTFGGIQPNHQGDDHKDGDEDMTMEFTSVLGGVLPSTNVPTKARHMSMAPTMIEESRDFPGSPTSTAEDETMEMTMAVGGIMPTVTTPADEQDRTEMGMEMTTALGGILQAATGNASKSQAKKVMEMEVDLGSSPFQAEVLQNSPPKLSGVLHTVTSETGSPSLAVSHGKGMRRSADTRNSTTPNPKLRASVSPIRKPATPSKQVTPRPARPTTPGKTPPSKNVVLRTASPKKLFIEELKVSTPQPSQSKKLATPNKLFQQDKTTDAATPSFVLTPRRSSGVGLDKTGLGSPLVAALLDRRGSIGDNAKSFIPSRLKGDAPLVRFEDPQAMEDGVDQERKREEDRENGRSILEREADQNEGKDATLNLKNMIETLSPRKKPLRGRKSLHVGAARGILGKRPIELDEDDAQGDDDDDGGIKRLKNHQGSPVKSVKLQAPPTKDETTTGRVTRSARKSLEERTNTNSTPVISVSPGKEDIRTPRPQGGRFKDAEEHIIIQDIAPPTEKEPDDDPQIDEESFEDVRIQLQDFLNMTSIRFMELTTTKRRHTMANKSPTKDTNEDDKSVSLEDCVAAGAATIPMLELFQHACHELKRYISEGRKTVREIESETFEENPPLFREYISATPDMKILMDSQLKNVKTHARLLSKEMWYDWRMTLLSTLKEGLLKTAEGMVQDEDVLDHQQALLDTILPQMLEKAENLEREEADLQESAEEIASCNQEELSDARQQLIAVDADIESKLRLIAELRKQVQGKEAEIDAGTRKKEVWQEEVRGAEKIREECRGWTSNEISVLKAKVDIFEQNHGWTITGISGTIISMTYQKEVELVFDAASFTNRLQASQRTTSNIDLWYIGASRASFPIPLTTEKEFFLECMRDHVRGLDKARTPIVDLLRVISISWNRAKKVAEDIRLLRSGYPTHIFKTSDNSIMIKSSLLIGPLTSKVEINFLLESESRDDGMNVNIIPSAIVVYGERFNELKMGEFLLNRCGDVVEEKGCSNRMSWGAAVAELGEKLLARGRK